MGGSDERTTADGLELLADETRVGILRALVDRIRTTPDDPAMGFAELRRAVGVRDSGTFNYHLEKLEGRFVRDTGDGYRITVTGVTVSVAVERGAYDADADLGPVGVGADCPECGGSLRVLFPDGRLSVTCSNGHAYGTLTSSRAVAERDLQAVIGLVAVGSRHDMEFVLEGVCPICEAHLPSVPTVDLDRTVARFQSRCRECAAKFDFPVGGALRLDPGVAQFYDDHGVDARTDPPWHPAFTAGVDVTEATDRNGYRAAVELEETPVATLDDSLRVVAVER